MTTADRLRNQQMLLAAMGQARFLDANEPIPVRTFLGVLEDRRFERYSKTLTHQERRVVYLLETGKLDQFRREFPKGLPPA